MKILSEKEFKCPVCGNVISSYGVDKMQDGVDFYCPKCKLTIFTANHFNFTLTSEGKIDCSELNIRREGRAVEKIDIVNQELVFTYKEDKSTVKDCIVELHNPHNITMNTWGMFTLEEAKEFRDKVNNTLRKEGLEGFFCLAVKPTDSSDDSIIKQIVEVYR